MTLKQLTERIREFCEERGWSHSNPTGLISSTLVEMGELAEHYQWQKEFKSFTKEEKKEISYEFVDVMWYLIRLADKSGIDLEEAFEEKIPKLAKKFPVGSNPQEQHDLYRKNGKNKLYD